MDSLGTDLEASDYRIALKRDARTIQPCGCLVTVDRQWRRVRMASANLEDFFSLTVDAALTHSPQRLLGKGLIHELQQDLAPCPANRNRYAIRRLSSSERSLLVAAHATPSGATLEIEPCDGLHDDLAYQAMAWGDRIAECDDEDALLDLLLRAVRELSGHDHASAHPLAPASAPSADSSLYLCMVADTQAAPIPLVGTPPASHALPSSELQALATPEAQRLRQEGIHSMLSISFNEAATPQWGTLISHSNVPRHLPSPLRRLLRLITRTALQRLHLLEARHSLQRRQRFLDAYPQVTSGGQQHPPIRTLRAASKTWLNDFRACGMLLIHGNQINGVGTHPDKTMLCKIMPFLKTHAQEQPWASHELTQLPLAELPQANRIGGLLAVALDSGGANDWLLLFRPAVSPNGHSRPWSHYDRQHARDLARLLSADITARKARKLSLKLQEHNATLMQLAHTDPVTQIANRHHIEQILDAELLVSEKDHTPCSLLLFDIDHFKRINDTHGHNAGDKILRRLASEVQARLRTTDHLGRWGGEEFLIIASGSKLEAAVELANRLCHEIPSLSIPPVERLSVSIGVTRWEPGDTPRSIVRRADLAMYEAKDAGRGCVRVVTTQ